MREQSLRNEFESETARLQQEASLTQQQLALHAVHDRYLARVHFNLGLADGATGMADMADAICGGWVAEGDAFTALAHAARLRAEQAQQRVEQLARPGAQVPCQWCASPVLCKLVPVRKSRTCQCHVPSLYVPSEQCHVP